MKALLLLVDGELPERVFPFEKNITLGRQRDCGITLFSARVSRRHCVVENDEEGWLLEDLASRNGTLLNGGSIHKSRLSHGDRIQVSQWTFLFVDSEAKGQAVDFPADSAAREGLALTATEELSAERGHYFHPEDLLSQETRDSVQGLDALLRLCRILPGIRTAEELEARVLPLALAYVPARRIVLKPVSPGLEAFYLHHPAAGPHGPLDAALVARVVGEGVAVLSGGERQAASVLCVPLPVSPGQVLGVLYLESAPGRQEGPEHGQALDSHHLRWMTAFAGMVAPALGNLRYLRWLENEVAETTEPSPLGESESMQDIAALVARVASTDSTVLIRGESGTGKEVVARRLHQKSPRAKRPFVAINCATLSDTLLESELFGHERGAFTGAVERKVGKLELAHGGTLFLDEIGDLALALQAKLLRVVETLEFERVGGTKTLRVDVRLVAATHRDLEEAITEGRFRSDLYYRLNVIELYLPPLRERPEDIPALAHHFLNLYSRQLAKPVLQLASPVVERLKAYPWPGNVRELRNAVERAVVLAHHDTLEPEDFPGPLATAPAETPELGTYHQVVEETRRRLIRQAISASQGNVTAAAQALGLSPNYLHRLMTRLGLRGEPGKGKRPGD